MSSAGEKYQASYGPCSFGSKTGERYGPISYSQPSMKAVTVR